MAVPESTIAVCVASFISFSCLNKGLDFVAAPKRYADDSRRYKWRNAFVSFVHAVIVGFGGTYCLLSKPALFRDQIYVQSKDTETFLAISLGYLLYDIVDLVKTEPFKKVFVQVIHHILAALFVYAVLTSQLMHGIGSVAMVIEVSGVFLHVRILLLMYDFEKRGVIWNVNAFINIFTFFVVRMCLIMYIFFWSVANRAESPALFGTLVPFIALLIFIFNVELFRRLFTSDYLRSSSSSSSGDAQKDENILDS